MDQTDWRWRYLLLACDCLIAFGCFYCVDIPSALQTELQSSHTNCTDVPKNETCCEECLGIGPDHYNQLYAVFSWTNAVIVLPIGVLLDRIGNRITSIVSTLMAAFGAALFALSVTSWFRMTAAMFPMMIVSRGILGAANGGCQLVQDRVIAYWFPDKLGLAFGAIVSVIRCGNVLNFFITSNIAKDHGVPFALWTGVMMCGVGFLAAVGYCILDTIGCRKMDKNHVFNVKSPPLKCSDIRKFPLSYWLVAVMISTYYSCFIPYVANGSKFIQDKYGYSRVKSSYINGAVYDVSIVVCLSTGLFLDRFGGRAISATVGGALCVPVIISLSFFELPPLLLTICFGAFYSVTVVSLWPSIAKVVPLATVGTANGIAAFLQGLNVGLTNLGMGKILGAVEESDMNNRLTKWKIALTVLLCQASICTILGIWLNVSEKMKKGSLNGRYKKLVTITTTNEKSPLIESKEDFYESIDSGYSIQT
ncbi:major facilitator superfamily domain-containing protein 1-like [Ostrea edulis]|uniref:major facilitator superfamily domain-containing protein 1-like n=1 Tax=Ostrea edulis TaxID=37623 RepID=UPI002096459C|nr:major facilitator superfamily domain-containing protein 1-like [Ostrea edulis]